MRRVIVLALAALLVGCDAGTNAPEVDIAVDVPDKNGSGIYGTAEVTRISEEAVRIVLALDGAVPDERQLPAYLILGGCSSFEPQVAAELEPVIGGKSISEVDVALADITASSYGLAVGSDDPDRYVACGDLVP